MGVRLERIGLVVHPDREIGSALETLQTWAAWLDIDLVQLVTPGQGRQVAPAGDVAASDLVIALGGDGTTLVALHVAAPAGRPVLGVACGSLGVLTAVGAERLSQALDRVAAGEWTSRRLPALAVDYEGRRHLAINDLVLVRRGAGQVIVEIEIDGERFIRFAGDGLVAATPLGSTAYTLAAGGPMLASGTAGLVLTPLAPHAGVCPPLVTAAATRVRLTLEPGHAGARVEVDGRVEQELGPRVPVGFSLALESEFGTLVSFGDDESHIAGLRRRRILVDSARILARDARAR